MKLLLWNIHRNGTGAHEKTPTIYRYCVPLPRVALSTSARLCAPVEANGAGATLANMMHAGQFSELPALAEQEFCIHADAVGAGGFCRFCRFHVGQKSQYSRGLNSENRETKMCPFLCLPHA
jgi:hypothetical protein